MTKTSVLKKTLCLLLALMLGVGAFACKKKTVAPEEPPAEVEEVLYHYWDGGLHRVSAVDNPGRTFVTLGNSGYETEYSVVIPADNTFALEAANFIAKAVSRETGAAISILKLADADRAAAGPLAEDEITLDDYSEDRSKYIVLGCRALFDEAGLTMPEDDLGAGGYYITTKGASVFIEGCEGRYFFRPATIGFLKSAFGYDMISGDTIVYERDMSTIPDLEVVERPDYTYRLGNCGGEDSDRLFGMNFFLRSDVNIGFNHNPNNWCHNSFRPFIDKFGERFYEEYPDFLADDPSSAASGEMQLCYTAHGNEESLRLMVDTVADAIIAEAEYDTTVNTLNYGIRDNWVECHCPTCAAMKEKYGTMAASQVKFINLVDDKVQAWIAENQPGREFYISIFAYYAYQVPPAEKDENGNWRAIDDTVKCNDHVCILYAPLPAIFGSDFYDEVNAQYREIMEGWSVLTNRIDVWIYETNFHNYIFPFESWEAEAETLRFFKIMGGDTIISQGQRQNPDATAFTALKSYVDSRLMFDVNCDYGELVDKFFKEYFGPAERPMRDYFDRLSMWLDYCRTAFPQNVWGYVYEPIASASVWPRGVLDGWMGLIDDAYAAIEPLSVTEPELYERLRAHVCLESIFPRYALQQFYPDDFGDELKAFRTQLANDIRSFNMTQFKETNGSFESIKFIEWGV